MEEKPTMLCFVSVTVESVLVKLIAIKTDLS